MGIRGRQVSLRAAAERPMTLDSLAFAFYSYSVCTILALPRFDAPPPRGPGERALTIASQFPFEGEKCIPPSVAGDRMAAAPAV